MSKWRCGYDNNIIVSRPTDDGTENKISKTRHREGINADQRYQAKTSARFSPVLDPETKRQINVVCDAKGWAGID
jgi:hypothetical protein